MGCLGGGRLAGAKSNTSMRTSSTAPHVHGIQTRLPLDTAVPFAAASVLLEEGVERLEQHQARRLNQLSTAWRPQAQSNRPPGEAFRPSHAISSIIPEQCFTEH
jgi:hypothetical protein